MLPPHLKRETKPGMPKRIRCPAHLKWVREHACCVPGCHGRPIEAAHVRTGTDGGTGQKPSDFWTVPLCGTVFGAGVAEGHHAEQHRIGEPAFERKLKELNSTTVLGAG